MPADLRDSVEGPCPYYYEGRYDQAPNFDPLDNDFQRDQLKGTDVDRSFGTMINNVRNLYLNRE